MFEKIKKGAGDVMNAGILAGGLVVATPGDAEARVVSLKQERMDEANNKLINIGQEYRDKFGKWIELFIEPYQGHGIRVSVDTAEERELSLTVPGNVDSLEEFITPESLRVEVVKYEEGIDSDSRFKVNETKVEISAYALAVLEAVPNDTVSFDKNTGVLTLSNGRQIDITGGGENALVRMFRYTEDLNSFAIFSCVDELSGKSPGYIINLDPSTTDEAIKKAEFSEIRDYCR